MSAPSAWTSWHNIRGQDSKVNDSVMNDKCAVGTGRFLEVMARSLEMELEEFGHISLQAEKPANISSLCTVFAEDEILSGISVEPGGLVCHKLFR